MFFFFAKNHTNSSDSRRFYKNWQFNEIDSNYSFIKKVIMLMHLDGVSYA
jgi:hypothetical protein